MSGPATAGADQPAAGRWAALYVLCGGMLMIVLDVTVVNVALPSIQDQLGFSSAALAWVVNAYLISFGGLLLLAGRLGDLLGRRRVFLAGVTLFTLSSLACGLADSRALLVAARFVQGVGGAMTSAVILGMIVTMFAEPREQAKAIGVYAFVASAGGSVGLLAGGVITQSIDWHWIFFVNVPIGIVTVLLTRRMLEPDRGLGLAGGADVPGAALITAALMLGVYAIVGPAAAHGWLEVRTIVVGAGAVALLAGFFVRESRAARPLVALRVLRVGSVLAANAIQVLSVAGMFGMFFLGALYLRRVLGYDALQIGLSFLPVSFTMGLLSIRYSERLMMRFGALFARAPVHGSYLADVLPSMVLVGLGAGVAFPALMNVAMSGANPHDAGLASGLVNTTAQVGGALGLAVLATLSQSRTRALSERGVSSAAALTGGYHLAFWIAAALVAASVVVAGTTLRRRAGEQIAIEPLQVVLGEEEQLPADSRAA